MKDDDASQPLIGSGLDTGTSPRHELDALERKLHWAQDSQALAFQVLTLLGRELESSEVIRKIFKLVKEFTGFEAVGIRLSDGEDFPYFETKGFPSDFVKLENFLCSRNETGDIIRDSLGNPLLDCMCGNIIQGRTDPSLPFFTPGGSFWSNSTTELLATTTEEERQSRTRNRCNGEGYESVALIPLRSDREVIGLLQLNDSRKNCFTLDMISFFEGIGVSIGIVLGRKRLEQERNRLLNESIRRAAQLEAANKELESFSYSVSHDLRAPLRAISGFARILEEDYKTRLDDEGRRLLGVVQDEARRMGTLIDDLLALSRLGRKAVRKVETDMTALAREVFGALCLDTPKRSVDFRLADLPSVTADSSLLRQVWANLLGNALKFTRNRERAEIEVGGLVEDSEAVYYVRDNGVGFDMKYADKLFGVFQRLHGRNEFEGAGIGLALAQRIVHRHGGRIWAEARVDSGATFYFALPQRKDDANEQLNNLSFRGSRDFAGRRQPP